MRKLIILAVLCVGTVFLANTAFASSPRKVKNCGIDADGDGYCVPDSGRTQMVDPADASAGVEPYHRGTLDCNDNDAKVSPGQREIAWDGIDQDCDAKGEDLVSSEIADKDTFKRYAAKRGCNYKSSRCIKLVDHEFAECEASDGCTNSDSNGVMKITNRDYLWYNSDCKGGREVMSRDERKELDNEARARGHVTGHRCASRARRAPKRTGARKKASPPKRGASAKALDLLTGKIGENATGVSALKLAGARIETELGTLAQAVESGATARALLTGRIDDVEGRLDTAEGAITANGETAADASTVATDASRQAATANEVATAANDVATANAYNVKLALSHGPLFELGAGYGALYGGKIPLNNTDGSDGGVARGRVAHSLQLTASLGYDAPTWAAYARLGLSPEWTDGPDGSENGLMYEVGPAFRWHVSGASWMEVGVSYIARQTGGDVLDNNAQSQGVLGWLGYRLVKKTNGPAAIALAARVGVGYETFGTDPEKFERVTGSSPMYMLSLGGTWSLGRLL